MMSKIKTLLLVSFLLSDFICLGQYNRSILNYTNVNNTHMYRFVSRLNSHDQLVIAMSGNLSDSLYFFSVDSNGTLLWSNNYAINIPNLSIWSEISTDSHGNFYLSARTNFPYHLKFNSYGQLLTAFNDTSMNFSQNPTSSLDMIVNDEIYVNENTAFNKTYAVKYDTLFNLKWKKVIDTAYSCFSQIVYVDSNKNVFVVSDTLNTNYEYDEFLIKLDSSGNFLSRSFLSGTGGWTIHAITSDNYLVRACQIADSTGKRGIGLFKHDLNGVLVWDTLFPHNPILNDYPIKLKPDKNGNVYLLSSDNIDYLNVPGEIAVRKIDSIGTIIWRKTFYGTDTISGYCNNYAEDLVLENDSIIFITGSLCNVATHADAFVAKLDSSGNLKWQDTYNFPLMLNDNWQDIHINNCGDLFVVGRVDSSQWGNRTFLMCARYANQNPNCFPVVVEADNTMNGFSVFPNPTRKKITINMTENHKEVLAELFDIAGKMIFSEKSNVVNKQVTLDISNVNSGVYFLRIADKNDPRGLNLNIKILKE